MTAMTKRLTPYGTGQRDFVLGRQRDANPYVVMQSCRQWAHGWRDAEALQRANPGAYTKLREEHGA